MIKILHCADLHLDSPLSALNASKSEVRRNDLRAAFTALTLSAKINNVDFLLIAGDLFDCEFVSKDTVALLCREFEAIPDCKVIIAPGNHDPYTNSSYYRLGEFPENVYIFDSPEISCFNFPEKNTTVYGWAFTEEHMTNCPLDGFSLENPDNINILVAHGDLDRPDSNYCPISSKLLTDIGFDYVALGHRHTFEETGNGRIVYSGCLEGRGFDETGEKGAVLAALDKDDAGRFAAKFLKFSRRRYSIEDLDISGALSNADVITKIEKLLGEIHYGDDLALRIYLTGEVSGDFKISPTFIAEQFSGLFLLEIIDRTLPILDKNKLRDDLTIKGAYFRALENMLLSDDKNEREIAAMALRYGLAALGGNDIVDF